MLKNCDWSLDRDYKTGSENEPMKLYLIGLANLNSAAYFTGVAQTTQVLTTMILSCNEALECLRISIEKINIASAIFQLRNLIYKTLKFQP